MSSAASPEWDDRKDRSIRLWGPNGQRRMEKANALVLGATATACETLKNLVLPGLGHYTIVDERNVSASTFEANFYVDRDDVDKPLAACVVRNLSEMNTDPTGTALQASPVEFAREVIRDKSKLHGFTIVLLSCPLTDADMAGFGAACHELDIPIIVAKSAGLLGYVRSSFKELCCLEPKNNDQDTMKEDFWLSEFDHFPELQLLSDSMDADDMTTVADIPPFILLRKAFKGMRDSGSMPPRGGRLQWKDVEPFIKDLTAKYKAKHPDAGNLPENITEASCRPPQVILPDIKLALHQIPPASFTKLIADPRGSPQALTRDTSSFWLLVCALREFAEAHNGRPPLSGRVPDQPANSANFVALLQVYRSKRDSHVAWLLDAANRHATRCGARQVTHEEARDMVEHASFAVVFTGSSLEREFGASYKVPPEVLDFDYAGDCRADPMAVYPLFRAWFRAEALSRHVGGTAPDFRAVVGMMCGDLGVPVERLAAGYEAEIQRSWDPARGAPVEIATVASVIGGIAANEAVKHIVKKFQPIDNTIIYDGANLEYSLDFKL